MTTEERFERIEHFAAGWAEERRRDREEYKSLWRDTQRQLIELSTRTVQVDEQIAALTAEGRETDRHLRETDRQLRELGKVTDARIAALVSAIGEHVRVGHPPQSL
jgi:capsid protein